VNDAAAAATDDEALRREAKRAAARAEYEERKTSDERWCTREGCRRQALEDSLLCKRHRRTARAARRTADNARRERRRARGECIWCPGPKPQRATEPGGSSCLGCRVKRNRIRSTDAGASQPANQDRTAKILAATSKDPDGRTRYRGQQKRGQQPKHQLNEQDLRHITEDFETLRDGVLMLGTPEKLAMHRSDYQRAELAVAAVGDRMTRRVDDVLERLGHFKQRHGPRGEK
jgi:hypothetical protein